MKKMLLIKLFCAVVIGSFTTHAQIQKGLDIDGESTSDYFGRSVSMPDANTLAVGASQNDGNGSNSGHVRVYSWNGSSWIQKGIDIDGEAAEDLSGYTLSMPNSNTIAIGALKNETLGGLDDGHVRIYSWNGSAWIQKGADIDGEYGSSDQSGNAVSMPDENTVAIGTFLGDHVFADAGHVRIYSWNGSAWVQKGLDLNGEAGGDQSGYSVSMPDANTVAIGAPTGNGTNSGHVRIYSWNGTSWIQKGSDLDGEVGGDQSGYSVSMPDANTVAIGAPYNDGIFTDCGHARIYTWNGSAWVQKGMELLGEGLNDRFGFHLSMPDANTIAVGGYLNDGIGTDAGHVRVFRWNGTSWQQDGSDINGEAAGDYFGIAVNMPDANTVAIGGINNGGKGHARVYSYCLPSSGTDVINTCGNYTWIDGNTYTSSNNTATYTLTNLQGCDSIVTLSLTINSSNTGSDVINACGDYTWIDGNTYTVSNNSATYTLTNTAGCDSVVTLNLTITDVDPAVTYDEASITATTNAANYQWLDCDNNFAPIAGETNQSFFPSSTGSYAVIVSQNTCNDTSSCIVMNSVSLLETTVEDFKLSPNPSNGFLNVQLKSGIEVLEVLSLSGQVISSYVGDHKTDISLNLTVNPGVYLIRVTDSTGNLLIKQWIKQ